MGASVYVYSGFGLKVNLQDFDVAEEVRVHPKECCKASDPNGTANFCSKCGTKLADVKTRNTLKDLYWQDDLSSPVLIQVSGDVGAIFDRKTLAESGNVLWNGRSCIVVSISDARAATRRINEWLEEFGWPSLKQDLFDVITFAK